MADDDDALLAALIDRELDDSARTALEARLADDAGLRARLELLRQGGRPFGPAFQTVLDAAPMARLRASLRAAQAGSGAAAPAPRYRTSGGRAGVAAAIVLFCAGLLIGYAWSGRSSLQKTNADEDWRQAVAEYVDLYTVDTLSAASGSSIAGLALVSAKLGLDLTPERVALPKLEFKGAQIFDFHGEPLGQLGYLDPTTGPVFLCIIRNSAPDAGIQSNRRGGFSVATWARNGRGYMLIGRLPIERVAEAARSFEPRF